MVNPVFCSMQHMRGHLEYLIWESTHSNWALWRAQMPITRCLHKENVGSAHHGDAFLQSQYSESLNHQDDNLKFSLSKFMINKNLYLKNKYSISKCNSLEDLCLTLYTEKKYVIQGRWCHFSRNKRSWTLSEISQTKKWKYHKFSLKWKLKHIWWEKGNRDNTRPDICTFYRWERWSAK